MTGFPDFIRKFPEAETSLHGVTLWLMQGRTASATLFQAREDVTVPEHSHGAQWGIVVEGEMDLTIDKATRTCRRGDEFFFFSSRRRHTRFDCDWSSDVCSSD